MHRKVRTDTPTLAELHEATEPDPRDRREGSWTKLQLIEMNERFRAALRRAHPDPREWTESASRWPRDDRP
jgi:hypothetical protein